MKDGYFSPFPRNTCDFHRGTDCRTDVQTNHHRSCSAAERGTKSYSHAHACTMSGEPKLDYFHHASTGNWQPQSAASRRRNELSVLPVCMAVVPFHGAAFLHQPGQSCV